jgi:ADP-ribose pyrophosphatase YjhB (NUDIX family)
MKFKKLPYQEFLAIYRQVPRAAVDVIALSPQGFLLTKRTIPPFEGFWHIPGGTILFKEPIDHAITRIVQEELGVKVKVIKLLGIVEYFNDAGRHTVCNGFLAQIKSGVPRGSNQGEEVKFFKKIPRNFIPEQRAFLKKHWLEISRLLSA